MFNARRRSLACKVRDEVFNASNWEGVCAVGGCRGDDSSKIERLL